MDAVIGGLLALAGIVLGSVLQHAAGQRAARTAAGLAHDQAVRAAVVDLAQALSRHRGHLYDRWDTAHRDDATEQETAEARRVSHASRRDAITPALYRLRALTRHRQLLAAADAAVGATYAVKAKGEALEGVTATVLAARRQRAIDADTTLLETCARVLT